MVFVCLQYKPFEYTVGKGEIAHNQQFILFRIAHTAQFLLFPQFFYLSGELYAISSNSKLSSANSFSLEESKIYRLGKGQDIIF